jgi:type I restriction enzyme, S subunit
MNNLPKGWAGARLHDVCELINGRAYKQDELLDRGKYPVLRVGNFFSNRHWYYSDLDLDHDKYCDSGDLLYAWSASFGPRIWDGGKVIFHYHIWKTRPVDALIEKRFLYYWFEWDKENIKSDHGTGSTMIHVTKGDMEARRFALPPVPEQRRIVAKVDSLTGKSRRARDHLEHIPRLVDKYKQAILAAAFRGDLTREWRSLTSESDIKWESHQLGDIADIGTGATPKRGQAAYYEGGTIAWVTSGAVNDGVIAHADEYITPAALRETNCKLYPSGTLLMAMYGEGKTRGKVAVLGIEAATNQALAAISVHSHGPAERSFVLWYLRSQYLELREQAAGGVQPNLNLSIIKRTCIDLPSQTEQAEIVRRIETAFAWIDRLFTNASSARKLIDHLDQAMLRKAFKGELVPQDPADEPASALLERIGAERAAAPKPKRGRKNAA